eukprot:Gb_30642 [translate_table: standard]
MDMDCLKVLKQLDQRSICSASACSSSASSSDQKQERACEERGRCNFMGTPQKVSHFADLIHKVARSCLLHPVAHRFNDAPESLGGASSSDDNPTDDEISSDLTTVNKDDSRNESLEIFPLESDQYEKLLQKMQGMEALISDMFDTISSLKNAYVRLQAAHSPYDPERLHMADKAVIAELRKLSDLKQSYRRNKYTRTEILIRGQIRDCEEQKKILEAYEGVVKDLRSEVKEKNLHIEFLKENLREAARKKDKLERRGKKQGRTAGDHHILLTGRALFESPTPQLFESTMEEVQDAAKCFTKLLISHIKNANWDIDAAISSIESGITYPQQSHKKFAFESYVCQRMFQGFENETFYINGSLSSLLEPDKHRRDCFTQFRDMHSMEPMELLNILPDCPFGKFCNKKFLRIVHPKMEEAFFGNFDQRAHVLNGNHPRTNFYETFLKLAKAVWLLHKLAFSFNPIPSHFHVKRDAVFQPMYMESVVPFAEVEDDDSVHVVAFAVTPGFKVRDFIIKSQVYLTCKHESS